MSFSIFLGDVANEVETEQIVVDSTISNLDKANVTSFVQIRGSVPGQWSQDTGGHTVVPKPQIYFQNPDPTNKIAGQYTKSISFRNMNWHFVLKIVLSYCEKKNVVLIKKHFCKCDAEGREFTRLLKVR